MPDWIDFTPNLENQNLCVRLWCWPCHCGISLTNSCINCDVNGVCDIIWCCPCRVLCGWCPTANERNYLDEPKEYTYHYAKT